MLLYCLAIFVSMLDVIVLRDVAPSVWFLLGLIWFSFGLVLGLFRLSLLPGWFALVRFVLFFIVSFCVNFPVLIRSVPTRNNFRGEFHRPRLMFIQPLASASNILLRERVPSGTDTQILYFMYLTLGRRVSFCA